MSIFKKNFLPAQSQPWARQVEDRVRFFEGGLSTLDVNNRSKDEQFSAALSRLNAATITAQTSANAAAAAAATANGIINNIYTPGTTDIAGSKITNGTISIGKLVAGTITGDVINGGTITGVTIQSAASGQRVEMTGTQLNFYNGAATTGTIVGSTALASANTLQISNTQGYVLIANGSATSFGGTNSSAFTALAGNTQVNNGNFTVGDGNATFNNNITVNGRISSDGTYANTTTSATNLHIFSNGQFVRTTTTSTLEAKQNVRPLEFSSENFISVSPVVFDYKDGIVTDNSGKNIIGFIAEDFEDAGLGSELVTPGESNVDFKSLRYDKLYMFLHKVVQEQNETIKSLEARLAALESR